MKKIYILLPALLLFSCLLLPSPPEESAKNISLVCSIDYTFGDKWYKTPSSLAPGLSATSEVVVGQRFLVELLILQYALSSEHRVHLEYDLTIKGPRGVVYTEMTDLPCADFTLKGDPMIVRAAAVPWVSFEAEDQPGLYTVSVDVHDLISGETYHQYTTINLVESLSAEPMTTESELNDWYSSFHREPYPEKTNEAFLFYGTMARGTRLDKIAGIFNFFVHIYQNNPYLVSPLINRYPEMSPTQKRLTIMIAEQLPDNPSAVQFLGELSGSERSYYENSVQGMTLTVPEVDPEAYQLDILWGEFFASGSYDSLLRLVKLLLPENTPDNRVHQALLWSLTVNSIEYPLVNAYLQYMAEAEELDAVVKQQLNLILSAQ